MLQDLDVEIKWGFKSFKFGEKPISLINEGKSYFIKTLHTYISFLLLIELNWIIKLHQLPFYIFVLFFHSPEMEFKEFKSAKTRFKWSAGLNLETFDTVLSGTNHI